MQCQSFVRTLQASCLDVGDPVGSYKPSAQKCRVILVEHQILISPFRIVLRIVLGHYPTFPFSAPTKCVELTKVLRNGPGIRTGQQRTASNIGQPPIQRSSRKPNQEEQSTDSKEVQPSHGCSRGAWPGMAIRC